MTSRLGFPALALPRQLNAQTLRTLRRQWPLDAGRVVVDFAAQEWVQPEGTVGLACLVTWGRQRGQTVVTRLRSCANVGYWARMGFFECLGLDGPPATARHDPAGRFSELRCVSGMTDVDPLTEELVAVTNPDASARRVHGYVVSEALNNVCQHSGAVGYCASQYYASAGVVRFAIGDPGRGLTSALAGHRPSDDRDAIELALRVGITGRSRAEQLADPRAMRNRGIGLSAIARLVEANRGAFLLWSGSAAWGRLGSSTGVQSAPPWQGVLLAATLPRVKFIKNERDIIRELMPELSAAEAERQRRSRVRLP